MRLLKKRDQSEPSNVGLEEAITCHTGWHASLFDQTGEGSEISNLIVDNIFKEESDVEVGTTTPKTRKQRTLGPRVPLTVIDEQGQLCRVTDGRVRDYIEEMTNQPSYYRKGLKMMSCCGGMSFRQTPDQITKKKHSGVPEAIADIAENNLIKSKNGWIAYFQRFSHCEQEWVWLPRFNQTCTITARLSFKKTAQLTKKATVPSRPGSCQMITGNNVPDPYLACSRWLIQKREYLNKFALEALTNPYEVKLDTKNLFHASAFYSLLEEGVDRCKQNCNSGYIKGENEDRLFLFARNKLNTPTSVVVRGYAIMNLNYPFMVAKPDAFLIDRETGKILKPIEFKTQLSERNTYQSYIQMLLCGTQIPSTTTSHGIICYETKTKTEIKNISFPHDIKDLLEEAKISYKKIIVKYAALASDQIVSDHVLAEIGELPF